MVNMGEDDDDDSYYGENITSKKKGAAVSKNYTKTPVDIETAAKMAAAATKVKMPAGSDDEGDYR